MDNLGGKVQSQRCPSCGNVSRSSWDRMVVDTCGHVKCRRCLLEEDSQCGQCTQVSMVVEPSLGSARVEEHIPKINSHVLVSTFANSQRCSVIVPRSVFTNEGSTVSDPEIVVEDLENISSLSLSDEEPDTEEEEASASDSDVSNDAEVADDVRDWVESNCCDNDLYDGDDSGVEDVSKEKVSSDPDEVISRGVENSMRFLEEIKSAMTINDQKKKTDLESVPHIDKFVSLDGVAKYTCTVCERSFSHKGNIRYHLACADNRESLKCDYCDRTFKSSSHLTYHVRSVHTKNQPYKCNMCPKAFLQLVKLKRHKMIHTGERPFKCDTCTKTFKTNYQLKEHKNIHSVENHYPCSKCGKKFSDKNNLRRHCNIFHKVSNIKCKRCGECLETKFDLDKHMEKHKVYNHFCSECGKGFKHKNVHDKHVKIHSKTNPLSCNRCNKKFYRKDHLKRHILKLHTETENKPVETTVGIENEDLEELVIDEPLPLKVSEEMPFEKPKEIKCNGNLVGSINDLPAAIYNNPLELSEILKDLTTKEVHQVLENLGPIQLQNLQSVLSMADPEQNLPPKANVKKKLLNRYRNQSGMDADSVSVGGKFPKINLSSEQREASARALAKWIDENQASLDTCDARETETETGDKLLPNTQTNNGERTVIKMTPFGPRKMTIYDEEGDIMME